VVTDHTSKERLSVFARKNYSEMMHPQEIVQQRGTEASDWVIDASASAYSFLVFLQGDQDWGNSKRLGQLKKAAAAPDAKAVNHALFAMFGGQSVSKIQGLQKYNMLTTGTKA
jgi:hypothetical protein